MDTQKLTELEKQNLEESNLEQLELEKLNLEELNLEETPRGAEEISRAGGDACVGGECEQHTQKDDRNQRHRKAGVREVQDWHISRLPEVFRDIFGALTDAKACAYLRDLLVAHIRESVPEADLIVGLDSRGFLFNLLIATELGVECAPIRRKGKLAGEVVSVEYNLEYGSDTFEMQRSVIQPGQKVVIVDDLLATGGSLVAATELIHKVGGVVVERLVVMELVDLEGRKRLD
ncbi:hypothetical protein KR054_006554 [Drosophila jambulina]|nr:hypothetical protein KR054_006554 [Drosophila jambulina]